MQNENKQQQIHVRTIHIQHIIVHITNKLNEFSEIHEDDSPIVLEIFKNNQRYSVLQNLLCGFTAIFDNQP